MSSLAIHIDSSLGSLRDEAALDLERLTGHPVNVKARELVDAYLPRSTAGELFHYRGLDGFIGIMTSRQLWATHSGFMNDPTERHYAQSIVQSAVENVTGRAPDQVARFIRSYVPEILRKTSTLGVYVTSFSEADDLLSQWVTYTPAASGVAIGFDGAALSALRGATLRKVTYDRRQQSRILRALLRMYVEPLRTAFVKGDPESLSTLGIVLGMLIHECTVCFKNPSYAAEREWRLIAVLDASACAECVRYRSSTRAVVPYLEIPLADPAEPLPVSDIVIGPGLDFELNTVSIARFLKTRGVVVTPRHSQVPFRPMQ
jgi:Protein of unknown function (DUF2971)